MLWLYILSGVLLLLLLIMLTPIGVELIMTGDMRLKLVIGFIKITILPQKPKKKKADNKPKETKKKQKKKEPEEKKPNIIKRKGLGRLIDVFKRAAKLAAGALKGFFKHIKITEFSLSVKVAGSDAADTAVKYGRCCSAIYPAVGVIMRAVKNNGYGVDIAPDFSENAKTEIYLEMKARILVLWIAALVLRHGFRALRLLLDLR